MTRRDWWLGIALVAVVLVLHALVPRYDYRATDQPGEVWMKIDRWTGDASLVRLSPWSASRQ